MIVLFHQAKIRIVFGSMFPTRQAAMTTCNSRWSFHTANLMKVYRAISKTHYLRLVSSFPLNHPSSHQIIVQNMVSIQLELEEQNCAIKVNGYAASSNDLKITRTIWNSNMMLMHWFSYNKRKSQKITSCLTKIEDIDS